MQMQMTTSNIMQITSEKIPEKVNERMQTSHIKKILRVLPKKKLYGLMTTKLPDKFQSDLDDETELRIAKP